MDAGCKKESNPTLNRRSFLRWMGVAGIGLTPLVLARPTRDLIWGDRLAAASLTRPLMGTFVTVTVLHPSGDKAREGMEAAFAEMERVIPLLDRHEEGSPVSLLNRTGRLADAPPELREVLGRAEFFHRLTRGSFDITVKPVLDLFEESFSRSRDLPSPAEVRKAAGRVGAASLVLGEREVRFLREGMGVSLDGVAKGYVVDRAISVLRGMGVRNALINAGGDIRALGDKGNDQPWKVAIQDPLRKNQTVQVLSLREGAVATSGDYENYFDPEKKHHHIIDPGTGFSPQRFTSVSVTASCLTDADALATAAFVPSRESAMGFVRALAGAEALWIDRGGARAGSGKWPLDRA